MSATIELRRSLGLTQPQFAAALGCSQSTLIKWENGLRLLTILYRHPELIHSHEKQPNNT